MNNPIGRVLIWVVILCLAAAAVIFYHSQGEVPLGSAVVVQSPLFGSFRIYTGGRYYALVRIEKAWRMDLSSMELALIGSRAVRARTRDGIEVTLDVRAAYSIDVLQLQSIVKRFGPEDPASRIRNAVEEDIGLSLQTLAKGLTYTDLQDRKAWLSEELLFELTGRLKEKSLTLRRLSIQKIGRKT